MSITRQAVLVVLMGVYSIHAHAIIIQFDYRYDTAGFFNAARKGVLDSAADEIEELFTDNLLAIAPAGGNTWTAKFSNPGTGVATSLANLNIAQDTLLIFAGARAMGKAPGSTLADSAYGAVSAAAGTQQWVKTVLYRGQNKDTDFGPWGGDMSFNSDLDWYLSGGSGPGAAQYDFASIARHELLHILGFGGDQNFWTRYTAAPGVFDGPITSAYYDETGAESVPLTADKIHWPNGTNTTPGSNVEPLMVETLKAGKSYDLTGLDIAAMCDIGWESTTCRRLPEPGTALLLVVGIIGLRLTGARPHCGR